MDNDSERFDYVIVGAGSAGCVLAERLTEDRHTRVALIEAGGPDRSNAIKVPALFTRAFGTADDWAFTTTEQAELGNRPVFFPRGRTLGGSSSINAMLWTRGHRVDYEAWASRGCVGWTYEDVRPYFERAECGPIRLDEVRTPSPSTADFLTACALSGHEPVGDDLEGFMESRVTHFRGLRWSAADGYLVPARHRPNLTVVTGGLVERLLLKGTHAVGVQVRTATGVRQVRARKEVILSAGSVGSPHVLMLSGIGPSEHLSDLGLPTVVDAPGVGQELTDHMVVPLAFTSDELRSPGVGADQDDIRQYLRHRHGPLGSNLAEALLFLRTRPELPAPDIELVLMQVPFGDHETTADHGLAVGVMLLQPRSRGQVTLRSAHPDDPPLINPRYLSDVDGRDLAVTVDGMRKAHEIMRQPVFAKWLGKPLTTGALSDTEADITRYIRRTGISLFHPVSTCRMGVEQDAVLDLEFRVRGTTGLRVVDASAMPHIVRGHTHAPTVMLAERAADMIRAAH
ncbi:GMC family oxidoreductase N-terminal domain-containing protein [Actinokineospora sp. NBRC 105648]|uniref:GMC family oxidoreductase n=1 Tax=Actinokineospora sp. NBRC 105648 TaxID=3032206 RepID=UPI0024A2AA15|nr:GMC family oxidoreductase N-terminal domain-containing protein [Actinokineospora sp. NBRC 105648]GLZ38917.1 putative GMC-type oxidoreductase [Actinokineospora sp. NBRC 105648]